MKSIVLAAAGLLAWAGAADAAVLYSQAWDGTSSMWGSQNDTNGLGPIFTAYDDFTIPAGGAAINQIDVTGGFYSPPTPAPISQFSLTLYADAGGVPGGAIASGIFADSHTAAGTVDGFQLFNYAFSFLPYGLAGGTYWVSVVPDLGFPPQWGWATSASGNGNAYQQSQGANGYSPGVNLAFDVQGTLNGAPVPEPAGWAVLLAGLAALGVTFAPRARRAA